MELGDIFVQAGVCGSRADAGRDVPTGASTLPGAAGGRLGNEYTSNDLVPAWISGEELLGQGILVTMMTGLDHMPCNMWAKLRALIGEPVKQKEQHGTGNEPCQPV